MEFILSGMMGEKQVREEQDLSLKSVENSTLKRVVIMNLLILTLWINQF